MLAVVIGMTEEDPKSHRYSQLRHRTETVN